MPETTFLQIQGRDQSASRVLELPLGPVRIGRGSHCEVRLGGEPTLGDVQCLLRRRGSNWHFQPVGPPGHVWIDGRPADQQRPLPVGSSLRVGDHWMTLRSSASPPDLRGSFTAPINVEVRDVEVPPVAVAEPDEPEAPEPKRPTSATAEDEERLRRWQARLEQRERWLKSRQDERTWEARWKAAGETIRGRAADNPPAPPPLDRRPSARPTGRTVEPRPASPMHRPAEPTRRAVPPRVPVRPAPSGLTPIPRIAPVPTTRALASLPADIVIEPPTPVLDRIEVAEIAAPVEIPVPAIDEPPVPEIAEEPEPAPALEAASIPAIEAEPIPVAAETPALLAAAPSLLDDLPAIFDPDLAPRERVAEPEAFTADWPSARTIFDARVARPLTGAAQPEGRRVASGPMPAEAIAPAQWSLPLWLGWFPTAVAALGAGVVGLGLAWTWTGDALAMNDAMRLALRPEKSSPPSIDPTAIPHPPWWQTTSGQRAAWAVAVERSAEGEDRAAEVRSLVEEARRAAPLSALSRFVVESPAGTEAEAAPAIGRTRDVVTLAWTGRDLRRAGKPDASLRAFHAAFDLAGRADDEVPTFDEARTPKRYTLTHEPILEWVARVMAGSGAWTPEQWGEALPHTAVAPLAAARVIQAADRPTADRLIDLAVDRAGQEAAPGFAAAEHLAAGGEALAARSRWTDALDHYRRAIDRAGDADTRRRYWVNLAEIAGRSGDETTRAEALDRATEPGDSPDEITRRARRIRDLAGLGRTNPRP